MARRTRRTPRDEGTSLAELLVSMMILGVIIAAVTTLTIGFGRATAQNNTLQTQVDEARAATERMSKTLRTAVMPSQLNSNCVSCSTDAFLLGQDFAVRFYANIDNPKGTEGPKQVTYVVTTDAKGISSLIEKVQKPDPQATGVTSYTYCDAEAVGASAACRGRLVTRTLVKGVRTDEGPMFAYYDTAARLNPAASGGSLNATALGKVLAIELSVTVQTPNATTAPPTTYIQRLTLPNVQSMIRQDSKETP